MSKTTCSFVTCSCTATHTATPRRRHTTDQPEAKPLCKKHAKMAGTKQHSHYGMKVAEL